MRKRIKYKNIFGMGFAVSVFPLTAAGIAHAQECTALPTCEEFGYLYTAEECAGRKYVKCPFDQTKYFCLEDNKSSGNCDNPKVGDILYSDMSCSADLVSGKTPIGVVFHAEKRLAIGLKTEQKEWMSVSVTDFPDLEDVPNLENIISDPTSDWSGKSNTLTVIDYCSARGRSCPAFNYVKNYSTMGTQTGDWYLPSIGEFNVIYRNKEVLNSSLTKAKGQTLPDGYPDDYHWSSSEYNYNYAWFQGLSYGDISYFSKNYNFYYVRPVLAF